MSKRNKAIRTILKHSMGGGVTAAMPTPGFEMHKCVALSGNEVAMCVGIGSIYAGRKLTKGEVKNILLDTGLAVVSGGGLALVATKIGHASINELLNFIPFFGWGVKGMLASSLTAGVGWAFLKACELIYDE